MKHLSFKTLILIPVLDGMTVSDGQFRWGACLRVYLLQYFSFFTQIRYWNEKEVMW